MTNQVRVAKTSSCDTEELRKLYQENLEGLIAFLYSYLKNQDDVEDTIQEVFIKLYSRLQEGTLQNTNLRSLLFTSARNHALNVIRQKKTQLGLMHAQSVKQQHYQKSDEESIINNIMLESIYDYVEDNFSELECTIFKLKYLHDFTFTEIAKMTKNTISTTTRIFKRISTKITKAKII